MYNVQCSYLPKCGSRLWIQIKHRLDLEHRYIQFMHAKLSLINLIYIKNSLYIRLSSHIVVNWPNLWTFFMLWFSQALTELRSAQFKSAPVILRTIYATWQPSASEVFVEPAQRKTVVVKETERKPSYHWMSLQKSLEWMKKVPLLNLESRSRRKERKIN